MSAPTPDFVLGYRAMMLDGLAREVEITKRVLAAVPEGKRDYRPDPHARTAWELAWHIANTDVQFMDGIADLKFAMANPAEADKPKTVAELVDWYDRNMKRGADGVRALSAEQLATPVNFMGVFDYRQRSIWRSLTITVFIIGASWRRICVRWGRRCLRFMEAVTTNRFRRRRKAKLPSRTRWAARQRDKSGSGPEGRGPSPGPTANGLRFTANRLVTSVISSAFAVRVMIGTVAGVLPA